MLRSWALQLLFRSHLKEGFEGRWGRGPTLLLKTYLVVVLVGAVNELLFVNSLKMKCAVLLGVAQMLLGVALAYPKGSLLAAPAANSSSVLS